MRFYKNFRYFSIFYLSISEVEYRNTHKMFTSVNESYSDSNFEVNIDNSLLSK